MAIKRGFQESYAELAYAYMMLVEDEKAREAAMDYIEKCTECGGIDRALEIIENLDNLEKEE